MCQEEPLLSVQLHNFFCVSPRKKHQLFLPCLCLINETWRKGWSTLSLCLCSSLSVSPRKAPVTAILPIPRRRAKQWAWGEHVATAVGCRQAVFYLRVSSLLGWPRRWKISFSILPFLEWVILQRAVQEVGMILKGKAVLAGYWSMQAKWR